MLNIEKILVAKDSSPCAETALRHAANLARKTGAELHILYVQVMYEEHFEAPVLPVEPKSQLLERLQSHTQEFWSADGDDDLKPVVYAVEREVAAAPAIARYAAEHDIGIIFMGTHGRRGLRHLLMGSVAEEVVRTAPCQVVTVGQCNDEEKEIRSILAPVDFSTHAGNALEVAVQMAKHYGAHLDMLHVVEETLHPAFYNSGVFSIYDIEPDIEGRSLEHLKQLFKQLKAEDIDVGFHVQSGRAASEITHFAREKGHDLIVMATHGLTELAHLFIGSVTEKVVRSAPCSVLTVKSFSETQNAANDRRIEEEVL